MAIDNCTYLDRTEYESLPIHDTNLTVLQPNIRGLINKQSEFSKILNNGSTNKVDVALLCETWLRQETNKLVNLPNHHHIGKEQIGKKGGGVGILIDRKLTYKPRPDLEIDIDVLEHLIIEVKGDKNAILLVSCYQAPNTDQVMFLENYEKLLKKLKKERCLTMIGLDHNLDLLKSSNHRNTQKFLVSNLSNRMLPYISKPMCVTHTTAILIDNIFCTETLHDKCTNYILIDNLSDHLPCICSFENIFPIKLCDQTTTRTALTKKNICKIKTDLNRIDWPKLLSNKSSCDE